MLNTAIIPSQGEFSTMMDMAEVLVKGGFLPQSIQNAQAAVSIILLGRELNIPPWQAINSINVINRRPTISPQLMLALIERSGRLDDIKIDSDAAKCTVMMKRKGRSPHTETFTMTDAQAMQLAGKDNWKKQPAVMLKWRAVAACARVVFPDVLMGLYTPEEINPDVTVDMETGEIIESPMPPTPTLVIIDKPAELPKPSVEQPQTDGSTALKPDPIETHWSQHEATFGTFCARIEREFKQDAKPLPIDWLAYKTPKDAFVAVQEFAVDQHWPLISRKVTYIAPKNGGGGEIQFHTPVFKLTWYAGRTELDKMTDNFLSADAWTPGDHDLPVPVKITWSQKVDDSGKPTYKHADKVEPLTADIPF